MEQTGSPESPVEPSQKETTEEWIPLEKLFGGALPKRSVILVYGPPEINKSEFVARLMLKRLQIGDAVVYITTDDSYESIKQFWARIGINVSSYEAQGLIHYIDAYSKEVNEFMQEKENVTLISDPQAISELGIAIHHANSKLWVLTSDILNIYDSLSTSLTRQDYEVVLKFLRVLLGKIKRDGATMILVVEEGMHPEELVTAIKHLSDVIIHLKYGRVNRISVAGKNAPQVTWEEYEVRQDGIFVKNPENNGKTGFPTQTLT